MEPSPEADLVRLKKRRAVIQGSCTRIKTFVDSLASASITSAVASQLHERRAKLETFWTDYESVQGEIELQDDHEACHRANFEEAFYALSARIRELLSYTNLRRDVPALSPAVSGTSDASETSIQIRLPKINLPTFSGRYDEWFPFFDTFNSLIHINTSLDDIQKLQYLRASLSGDAKNIISALEISAVNYGVAWGLLKERFDNRRVIAENHIKAIMELPSMSRENAYELRRIADGATRHIHALQALKRPTAHWDDLLVHILGGKLDAVTMREWQNSLTSRELPSFKQFIEFATHRCQILESAGKLNAPVNRASTRSSSIPKRNSTFVAAFKLKCAFCGEEHSIYYCSKFLALSVTSRIDKIRRAKICLNCLRTSDHSASKCSSGTCRICKMKHNTLLHISESPSEERTSRRQFADSNTASNSGSTVVAHSSYRRNSDSIILSTAVVFACDARGLRRQCRVLLDCGSQANFISKQFLNELGVRAQSSSVSISGVNNTVTRAAQSAKIQLKSRTSAFCASVNCLVTDQVTGNLPAFSFKRKAFDIPRNIQLADPHFHISSKVDMLLGAELFWRILCVGRIKPSANQPILQKTLLGWILAGRLTQSANVSGDVRSFHASTTNEQLLEQVSRFWQLEAITGSNNYTADEAACEQHFLDNVSRNPQGRYIVRLPFKANILSKLGDSKRTAMNRFLALERRLSRDADLKIRYVKFLDEYEALGHMRRVDGSGDDSDSSFYLPHHCVFKASSGIPKIRVVFDASSKSSTGVSLNNALMVGPVVQQDLMSILLRFRTFIYVLVADIIKMYRQILVDPSQTQYQRILWRKDFDSSVETYELTTVTYGMASASYLATRCLNHLTELYQDRYPIGVVSVRRDFYVDDLLTGANTIAGARAVRDEVIGLLREGGFELSKWSSNCPELLEYLNRRDDGMVTMVDGEDSSILGIHWNHSLDSFYFTYNCEESQGVISKRVILSEVARLFDPLGFLGPATVVAKLIMQELWRSDAHWDESVPPDIDYRWRRLKSQLRAINQIRILRCVKFIPEPQCVQLHGFCDASQKAFGACIYMRTQLGNSDFRAELLCSKSRVAPIKSVSIPRLELSAALLLAQLFDKVKVAINLDEVQVFLWSDSTIVLNWIASPSRKWTVFVANRVGEIQRLTNSDSWSHVPSASNPADLLSRGLEPQELAGSSMWWHGPPFLTTTQEQWPSSNFTCLENMPEQREVLVAAVMVETFIVDELMHKYSSLNKICRILAYCLRFFKKHRSETPTVFVSISEHQYILNLICRHAQRRAFPEEYRALRGGNAVGSSSRLLSLAPFLSADGLIRVGGRLQRSELSFDSRHPILLPCHELTKRIIRQEHVRSAHAGVQATMAAVRQRFWPLSLRSETRRIIKSCVACFKAKPATSEAIMGPLPYGRVTVSRPFHHCGIDYAGPLILRECRRRNARTSKAYIAVFVCFATRAIHIELVSDLTSDSFIAALKRFSSRRGKPACLYSDNGTNFVGARRQLSEFYEFLQKDTTQAEIRHLLRDQKTSWNFIPPHAPHFGGLWEAAVKSAKNHLHRIVGGAHLTFEEMSTVLCEIEAILNSRPIAPLSEDPNDLDYLTPGHFLVGTPLSSFPYENVSDINENRLLRWQRVEQLRQHFWQRWSSEYLNSLQERNKWKANKGQQLKLNQLVLLKQQGIAPMQWLLGRIENIHPGADGEVRVATVKTASGSLTRPLSRIAILPINC